MPKPTARLGDATTGVCSVHGAQSGTITSASTDSIINDKGIARMGDVVTAGCGHTGNIVSTSTDSNANSKGIARIGDSFSGTYSGTIISGSADTNTN